MGRRRCESRCPVRKICEQRRCSSRIAALELVGSGLLDVAPDASFEGGFDLVVVESIEVRSAPGRLASLLRKKDDEDGEGVRRLHDLERATVRCERPLPVQVDGELLGDFDLIELGVVRGAARLLV